MTTADEENEVQDILVSSLHRKSKFWLVLFYWDGQTCWGEYEQGYMTRKKYLLHCFVIVISYCFSPALPCYNQSRHQLFRQWVIMKGYVIYSPKKNKGNRAKWKISKRLEWFSSTHILTLLRIRKVVMNITRFVGVSALKDHLALQIHGSKLTLILRSRGWAGTSHMRTM